MSLDKINAKGITVIGPRILGAACWAMVKPDLGKYACWLAFKSRVETYFGIPSELVRERFTD